MLIREAGILLIVKKFKMGSQTSKMNFIHFHILAKASKKFRIRVFYEHWSQENLYPLWDGGLK